MNLSLLLGKIKLGAIQNGPTIAVTAGTITACYGIYKLCKASTQVHKITEEYEKEVNDFKEVINTPEGKARIEERTKMVMDEDGIAKLEKGFTYRKYMKYVKLYAPGIIITAASLSLIFSGHIAVCKRVRDLAATSAAIAESYKLYRDRVAKKYGKEAEEDIYYNIQEEEIEVTETNDKGVTKTKKEKVKTSDGKTCSPYARFASESNNWIKGMPEYNDTWIKGVEAAANDVLKTRGYIFLNEVYKMLDMDILPIGVNTGWVLDGEHCVPTEGHDNYITFNLRHIRNHRHTAGHEDEVILDFNVDGSITEIFPKYNKAA